MNYYLYLIPLQLIFFVKLVFNEKYLYPNLPLGEYRIYPKAFLKCNVSQKNNNILYNLYFSKKSATVTEIKGNVTYKVPFDDSFTFHVNMAVRDSIGGWKDNAHLYSLPGGCSIMKKVMSNQWNKMTKAYGINNNCPINPGTYVAKDYEFSSNTSFEPKSFFYGLYKCRTYFTDKNNNQHGCIIVVFELKRPWETE